jgi:hypothetical protein
MVVTTRLSTGAITWCLDWQNSQFINIVGQRRSSITGSALSRREVARFVGIAAFSLA